MRIVILATTCPDENEQRNIVNFFAEEKMRVEFVGKYETLPGNGGEGGRSDLVFDMNDEDVSHASIHPWHLTGLFHWADEYLAYNSNIVPNDSKSLFNSYGV